MPPVAVAPALTRETYSVANRHVAATPIERMQTVLAEAYETGRPADIDRQVAADAETLVERLRKLRNKGGLLAQLALGPALAELHVRARLAG